MILARAVLVGWRRGAFRHRMRVKYALPRKLTPDEFHELMRDILREFGPGPRQARYLMTKPR